MALIRKLSDRHTSRPTRFIADATLRPYVKRTARAIESCEDFLMNRPHLPREAGV